MQKMIVSLLVFASVAQSQGPDPGPSLGKDQAHESQALAIRDVLYSRLAIVRRDGAALAGLLTGVKGGTLLLLVGGRSEKEPYQELAKVVVAVDKDLGKLATAGRAQVVVFANAIGVNEGANLLERLIYSPLAGGAGRPVDDKQDVFSLLNPPILNNGGNDSHNRDLRGLRRSTCISHSPSFFS